MNKPLKVLVVDDEPDVVEILSYNLSRENYLIYKAYNGSEGMTPDHETLPKKLFNQPLSGGRSDGIVLDPAELDVDITQYFELAGWDVETGVPRRGTLEGVGLGWVAEELKL